MIHHQKRALGQLLVGSLLSTAARRYPEREAIYCVSSDRRISFRELNERSNRLAQGLLGLQLPPGTVVAFMCSNRVEIIETYFALARTGLVGLPLNYRLAPAEVTALINAMGASVLICEGCFANTYEYLRTHSTSIAHTIWIGVNVPKSCYNYEPFLAESATSEPDREIDEFAPYYFNLTSGTTGLPKSYVLSQYNVTALDPALLAYDMQADDIILTVFPAFGRVGLGWLMTSIMLGTRNVLMDFDARTVLDVIQKESITFTNLVPTMASMLLAQPELNAHTLKSLRAIAFVGAILPPTVRDQTMASLCPRIYEGYGLQEVGWLTVSGPEDRIVKPDSVGKPVLYADVRIVDEDDNDVPIGEIGEIIGRSPNGILEYFDNPDKNAEVFRNGWFHTGDLGRLDCDGYLTICGRVKDMIISGGQNVYSSDIEAILLALPGVADCAIIGLSDDTWGERVTAVIVPGNAAPTEEQVRDFCRERLAGFKVPKQIFFQQEPLPRTSTGKVQKFLLVERYSHHECN